MDERDDSPTVEQAAEAFAAEVSYWREVRGLSKRGLARKMGFDPSYVSHVESGRHKPIEDRLIECGSPGPGDTRSA
ncbi:helix-turn-helix domain-containing protein [Kitasatospora sp. NPDC008050]|uniref:helix-turn-helix domain-containing protein n=1 Tax=Kitasatospora sp. NPDC008050 TaxID=3364021 RepID=UPI0036E8D95B